MRPVTTEDEMVEQQQDDFFQTPELVVPASAPDAHRAVVTSVTSKVLNNDKQTCVISINLRSLDLPTLETSLDIFVPKGYEEGIALGAAFNPSELPARSRVAACRCSFRSRGSRRFDTGTGSIRVSRPGPARA